MGSLPHRFWLGDSFTEDLFIYNEQPNKGPTPGLESPNLNWNPSKSQLIYSLTEPRNISL